MTFMVGRQIHHFAFSTTGQFLMMAVHGVEGLLPLYVYYNDKHKDDPDDSTPESTTRKPLLDEEDIFGEPLNLTSKPPE